MKVLIAALGLVWGCPVGADVWQADARSSAKFIRPDKIKERSYPKGCSSREKAVNLLGGKYGEAVAWEGVSSQGLATELWLSGTGWSILITGPDGRSCMPFSGQAVAGS